MGNFSRDPKARLADSMAKHYIGVRMQQGVPILDADWNELEDLRRLEFENVGTWFIGDGVPVGNDGFRIAPIVNGGVNTIVFTSKSTGIGISSISIDLVNSTAATALGFDQNNFTSTRFGSSPAQLTSNKAQPFQLANGNTLVVQADGKPPETITFSAGSFGNIATATAAEVVAAITATSFAVKAGTGNDFIVKGGDGTTTNAGRILVNGKQTINEADLKYTEQPLYKNNELAKAWGVDPITELVTPVANELDIIYIDIWHREVNSTEDSELIDKRIGLETANRLRREWAVRVAKAVDYPNIVIPLGHSFYVLAQLSRIANNSSIVDQMIIDERDTDASLRREIAYRGTDGSILVDSSAFLNMLTDARNNIRDFMEFLTGKFIPPNSAYVAGEVAGVNSLGDIASLADYGIAILNAKSLDTKGSFKLFNQILEVEKRFINIWKNSVLPINKGGGKIYEVAYKFLIDRITTFVTGPAPQGFITITDALANRNLLEAVRSQQQINAEFGGEIDRPVGFLTLIYLGSTIPTIIKNQSFDVRYKILGSVTPDDDIDVQVFADPAWKTTLKKSDGTLPFVLRLGPGSDSKEFIVTVQTPNVNVAETNISLLVNAHHNSGGLSYFSTQKHLKIGDPPPPSEQDFAFRIVTSNVSQVNGVFQVPVSLAASSADINFHFANNTNQQITVNFEFKTIPPASPLWTVVKGPFALNGNVIAPHGESTDLLMHFVPPGAVGESLVFNFTSRNSSTSAIITETQITLTTVNG